MMVEEVRNLLDQYVKWLRDKTTLRQVNDWVEITTPYIDRHNDYLQIYAKRDNNDYILTDDGYIINDLLNSGCALDSPKRQTLLTMTLNGFGVKLDNDSLTIRATPKNFPMKKHNLIQSMMAINDLFYVSRASVLSLFLEDVENWLNLNDIRYSPRVKFTGKSGYDHLFDFLIPKSKAQPERIIQTINKPNRNTAEIVAFSWVDTKDVRPPDSKAFAILNDYDEKITASITDALQNYDVKPVLWSQRERIKEQLAA
jgi:hypothetical protein